MKEFLLQLLQLTSQRRFTFSKLQLGYALVGAGALFVLVFFFITVFAPVDARITQTTQFDVEQGQGSWEIAHNLQQQGLIRSRAAFTIYAVFSGRAFKLQSGQYLLSPSMNAHTIMRKISGGDVLSEQITIHEGWNLRQIAEVFEKRGYFTANEFFTVTGVPAVDYRQDNDFPKPKDFSREFSFLHDKPDYISLEGYIFPDTYHLTANETPESFVRRALQNFEDHLTESLLAEIAAQERSLFEVVTFAAMIEKEVPSYQDKRIVAGVLQKRMDNGVRLQTDATVVYVREGNYYRVSIEETRTNSPYNTYVVYGLPVGPISNPGSESMWAVLQPQESPYWFYLSARDGTTIFSRTFEDHIAAKERYLR